MALITKIEAQKNNKDRYSIFIDDAFAFGIHVDVLVAHGLRKGMELTQDEIEGLVYDEATKKAVLAGIKHISYKQRTTKEVADKLKLLEYEESQVELALEKLKEMGFLDDLRYAQEFVDTRKIRYGRKRIFLELRKRGICEQVAEQVLDQQIDLDDTYAQALEMGRKKYGQCGGLEAAKAAARVQGMLLRKGYSYDVVNRVIKELGVFS